MADVSERGTGRSHVARMRTRPAARVARAAMFFSGVGRDTTMLQTEDGRKEYAMDEFMPATDEFIPATAKILNGIWHIQNENAFECNDSLSEEQSEECVQRFMEEIEDTDLAFVVQAGVPVHAFRNAHFVVVPDYNTGIYYVDLDTGIVLTDEGVVAVHAFCASKEVFAYKVCHFWADDGWKGGSTIHMGYGRVIGDEKIEDAIFRLKAHFIECEAPLTRLASGEMSLQEARSGGLTGGMSLADLYLPLLG